MGTLGRNDPCSCGSGRKYKKCCLDGERSRERLIASIPSPDAPVTVLIDTPDGVMARTVRHATRLDGSVRKGYAAEIATQGAAAAWGLPDFVFRGQPDRTGSGVREFGDGFLLVGDVAAVVQVKCREAPSADHARERRWLAKKAGDALRQADGTLRRLRQRPADLTSLRGTTLAVDANQLEWIAVAVLDHDDPPEGVTPSLSDAKTPAVALLRRDWEFLFEQLKSTRAVIEYLARVAGEPLELGREPRRYYELALADKNAPPEVLDPRLVGPGTPVSTPVLPLAPAATDDQDAHRMVRILMEDVATTRLTASSEADRLRMLAQLDRLPVGDRATIGRYLLDAMREVTSEGADGVAWRLRTVRGGAGRAHLGFGACSHPHTDDLQEAFSWWAQLRHHELRDVRGDVDTLTTVAVLLTPRHEGRRRWDTTLVAVSGETDLGADELRRLRELWPMQEAA